MKTIGEKQKKNSSGIRLPVKAWILAAVLAAVLFALCIAAMSQTDAETTVKARYDGQSYQGQDSYDASYYDTGYSGGTLFNNSRNELASEWTDGVAMAPENSITYDVDAGVMQGAGSQAPAHGRKLTYTYSYEAETEDFDGTFQALTDALAQAGGYIEASRTERNEFDGIGGTERRSVRRGTYTLRVPAGSVADVVSVLSKGDAQVTDESVRMSDRTEAYLDAQSQVESYEAEYARLEELLPLAADVTETIAIQDRLSSLNYQIQWARKQMELIDEDVDFSTVELSLYEVLYYKAPISRYRFAFGDTVARAFEEFVESMPYFAFGMVYVAAGGLVIIGLFSILFRVLFSIRNKKSAGNILHVVQDGAPAGAGKDGSHE